MKNIIVIILTTFFGSSINAQLIPFGFIKSTNLTISSVTIGTQVWTDKNLDVTTYRDGTVIPQVTDATWASLTTGAWCYYGNISANGTTYGKLYNWYAVAGIFDEESKADVSKRKKLAPAGWHVPIDAEWTTLGTYLGGINVAGGKMKTTGTSGFAGLMGGYRYGSNFYSVGSIGVWWSGSDSGSDAFINYVYYGDNLYQQSIPKNYGFSVRLIKD